MTMTTEQILIVPSTESDLNALKSVLNSIEDAMIRKDAEAEYVREAVTDLAKKYNLPKKVLNKLVRVRHKQNLQQTVQESEDLEELYTKIFK